MLSVEKHASRECTEYCRIQVHGVAEPSANVSGKDGCRFCDGVWWLCRTRHWGGQQGALKDGPGHVTASCLRGEGTATEQHGVVIKDSVQAWRKRERKYMGSVLPLHLWLVVGGGYDVQDKAVTDTELVFSS